MLAIPSKVKKINMASQATQAIQEWC